MDKNEELINPNQSSKNNNSSFLEKYKLLNSELEHLKFCVEESRKQKILNSNSSVVIPSNKINENNNMMKEEEEEGRKKTNKQLQIKNDKFLLSKIISMKKKHAVSNDKLSSEYNKLIYETGKLKSFVKYLETQCSQQSEEKKKISLRYTKKSREHLEQLKNIKNLRALIIKTSKKFLLLKSHFKVLQEDVFSLKKSMILDHHNNKYNDGNNNKISEFQILSKQLSLFLSKQKENSKIKDLRILKSLEVINKRLISLKHEKEKLKIVYFKQTQQNFEFFKKLIDFFIRKKIIPFFRERENNYISVLRKLKFEFFRNTKTLKEANNSLKAELFKFMNSSISENQKLNVSVNSKISEFLNFRNMELEHHYSTIVDQKTRNFEKLKSVVSQKLEKEIKMEKTIKFLRKKVSEKNGVISNLQNLEKSNMSKNKNLSQINFELIKKIKFQDSKLKSLKINTLELTELQEELEKSKKLNEMNNSRISGFMKSIESINAEKHNLLEENKDLRKNVKSIFLNFENEIKEKSETIKSLYDRVSKNKTLMNETLGQVKLIKQKYEEKCDSLILRNKKVSEELENQKKIASDTSQEYEQKIRILKTFLEKNEEEIEDLKDKNKTIIMEIKEEEDEKIYSLKKLEKSWKNKNIENEEKVEFLEDQISKNSVKYDIAKREIKKLRIENNLLLQNLKRKDNSNKMLVSKIEQLKKMI